MLKLNAIYCTPQVEFHSSDFEIALNKTRIVLRGIKLRFGYIYMNDYCILHDLLILIFTHFTSNYDAS